MYIDNINEAMTAHLKKLQRRGHLGMSQIQKDARELWYGFRWCFPKHSEARKERIFRLGDAIEAEIIRVLSLIPGVELHTVDGNSNQFNFREYGGHFSGSMDGCVRGLPDSSDWHVFEAKSANKSRFKELTKSSIKSWAPEYYTQVQCYMGASGMRKAYFIVYCKDDSELCDEVIEYDGTTWDEMKIKARQIILATKPPVSSYPNRNFYKLNFMSQANREIYFGERAPYPSCRNCMFCEADIESDGAVWKCNLRAKKLSLSDQEAGCDLHLFMDALVPGISCGFDGDHVDYEAPGGVKFKNVHADTDGRGEYEFTSWEIAEITKSSKFLALMDDNIKAMRREFSGEISNVEIKED